MIALIGPPPASFVPRIPPKVREGAIDVNGQWLLHDTVPLPNLSFEGSELVLKSQNIDSSKFLRFMRRMLQWEPEKRPTAVELLEDPWLEDVDVSSRLLLSGVGQA